MRIGKSLACTAKREKDMKKSRKPTLVEERHFPFECSTSYGVSDDYTALHWHKELEICYIRQGMGNYLINGTEYPFSSGDIFLIGNVPKIFGLDSGAKVRVAADFREQKAGAAFDGRIRM